MVDNISIRKKHAELKQRHANRQIDDYETFVQARVAEYYINKFNISTDEIYAQIEKALSEEPNSDSPASGAAGEEAVAGEDEIEPDTPSLHSKPIRNKSKNILPYIASAAGAAAIGLFVWIKKRGKRK